MHNPCYHYITISCLCLILLLFFFYDNTSSLLMNSMRYCRRKKVLTIQQHHDLSTTLCFTDHRTITTIAHMVREKQQRTVDIGHSFLTPRSTMYYVSAIITQWCDAPLTYDVEKTTYFSAKIWRSLLFFVFHKGLDASSRNLSSSYS